MRISKAIPSMYHQRLVLLSCLLAPALLLPALQTARLTLLKGEELRREAERRLVTERQTPTVRGRILDRKGRVLAADRPSFNVAFDFDVLTGYWATQQAFAEARATLGKAAWLELSRHQREEAAFALKPRYDAHLSKMWDQLSRLSGVSRDDLDQTRAKIIHNVNSLAATVTERARLQREQELRQAGETFAEVDTSDVRRPILEETTSHTLLRGVDERVGFALLRILEEDKARKESGAEGPPAMPGLRVLDAGRRDYPHESIDLAIDRRSMPSPLRSDKPLVLTVHGVATHVIGWMRSGPQADDVLRRLVDRGDDPSKQPPRDDLGSYEPAESVGAGGLERAAEFALRGTRGLERKHLDTGELEYTPPRPGGDVSLTLDVMLQARLQALFDPAVGLAVVQPWHKSTKPQAEEGMKELPIGARLNGAIVVIDIASGEILSLVTAPTLDRQVLDSVPGDVLARDDDAPLVNRAIEARYMPGSVVKPLVLCSAVSAGAYSPDERLPCTGHFYPEKPNLYRCWIYKQFHTTHSAQFGHDLEPTEALMVSCNVFFFELGKRLGPARIRQWYTKFGVGPEATPWNLFGGVPMDTSGIADPELRARLGTLWNGPPWQAWAGNIPEKPSSSDAVLMAIGQGPIDYTPLHAADAYATLARGGTRLVPRLLKDARVRREELTLNQRAVSLALKGLQRSAGEHMGTTNHIYIERPDGSRKEEDIWNAPGIDIWAKSGTADTAPFKADFSGFGVPEEYDGDHAWCVFLCGTSNTPKYACAVVVDHGGSGGRVSGPIANQVVHALIEEGYLPKQTENAETQR